MIDFKNYPPKQSGDIFVTDSGLDTLRLLDSTEPLYRTEVRGKAYTYGEAVGHTAVSASKFASNLSEMMGPVFNAVLEATPSFAPAFKAGFDYVVLKANTVERSA